MRLPLVFGRVGRRRIVLVVAGVALAQSDPAVGSWKLNTAKSKYDPGPMPKSNHDPRSQRSQARHVVARAKMRRETDGDRLHGRPMTARTRR